MDASAAGLRGDGGLLLVCRVRIQHELANALLGCGVDDGQEERRISSTSGQGRAAAGTPLDSRQERS